MSRGKLPLFLALTSIALGILSALFYLLFAHSFIHSVYEGRSWDFFNVLIDPQSLHPVEHYFRTFDTLFWKLWGWGLLGLLALAAFLTEPMRQTVKNFFHEKDHPLNLAVFRIVLFGTFLFLADFYHLDWYSKLPLDLAFPPKGLGWVLHLCPFNESQLAVLILVYRIFCITGMLGLWTRTSATVVLFTGLYVLMIPFFYGKVSHFHHVIWMLGVFIFSPAGDFLSLDAISQSFKRADRGITAPPAPSRDYALAIRWCWVFMGACYFFPGFWKAFSQGADWFLSDNLKFQFYEKWLDWDGWTPGFRLDHYPLLFKLSALGTILFEMLFIVLILFPKLRKLAFVSGLAFHNSTWYFIRIPFLYLQSFYLTIPDWHTLLNQLGRKIFPEPIVLAYDGNCKLCRRTIAAFRTFDVLDRVIYVNALDAGDVKKYQLENIPSENLLRDMHAVSSAKIWKGYDAYRAWVWRLPLLWPLLPFLYLWPIPAIGRNIYRRVADSRTCAIPQKMTPTVIQATAWSAARAMMVSGYFLLAAVSICGILKIHSWPFAVYPTFDRKISPERAWVLIEASAADGSLIPLQDKKLKKRIYPTRLRFLYFNILNTADPKEKERRLSALWKVWSEANPKLQQAVHVRFYKATSSLLPEDFHKNPLRKELLLDWNISGQS